MCGNNNKAEKFPPVIAGNAERPRPFNRKYSPELCLDYHFNKDASLHMYLFQDWLHHMDGFFGRDERKRTLPLIENFPTPSNKDSHPYLRNVQIEFLPSKTTIKEQPIDASITSWVRAKYKCRFLLSVFKNNEFSK